MLELKNYMEVCVEDHLDAIMKKMGYCTCEYCRMDVKALSLNSLPPKYIVTNKGAIYAKLSTLHRQFDVNVISAITKATEAIGNKPHHPDQEEQIL